MRNPMNVDERCMYFAFKIAGVMEVPRFEDLMQSADHKQHWAPWIQIAVLRSIYPHKPSFISNMKSGLVHNLKRTPEHSILLGAIAKVIMARFDIQFRKNNL